MAKPTLDRSKLATSKVTALETRSWNVGASDGAIVIMAETPAGVMMLKFSLGNAADLADEIHRQLAMLEGRAGSKH